MARIDVRERTLTLKLVYYGPAMGGKTTNLQVLHSFIDPVRRPDLLSLDTQGDRTLFFDLLPIDLDDVAGFKVKVRLFTVPGQVQYNATRRLVLRDADAAVFVADSTPDRLAANGESLASLHDNLVANGLKPATIPVIVQANKRDAPGAASLTDVDASLAREAVPGFGKALMPGVLAAAALAGQGVIETFDQALRSALASVHEKQSLGRGGITREGLAAAVTEALAPLRRNASGPRGGDRRAATRRGSAARPMSNVTRADAERALPQERVLEESVKRALDLAETLGDAQASGRLMAQRVRELETIQELSTVLVRATSLREVTQAVCVAARMTFGEKAAATLLLPDGAGGLETAGLVGTTRDPLLHAGTPPLALKLHRSQRPILHRHVETDLACGDPEIASALWPYCTLVGCPVPLPGGERGLLLAYGVDPETPADPGALRFVTLVAGQAALGLQAVDRHLQLVRNAEMLEREVAARTAELRAAHSELAASSRLKDRVLSCVNHELRTPVTKLFAAAQVIHRCKGGELPPRMLEQVVDQARHLAGLLDQVLTAHSLLAADQDAGGADGLLDVARVVEAAVFACQERSAARGVVVQVEPPTEQLVARADAGAVTVILAQLLDNAVKFTKAGTTVRVRTDGMPGRALRVVVMDQGPGVAATDAERIFSEFDQGSADLLTAKPNGLGLGLAIARRLARRLGGDVGVGPGDNRPGAAFWLELPTILAPAIVEEPVAIGTGVVA